MESILPTTDYVEVENRQYLNPQVALDESNQFIENLRSTQGQQNEQITTDTRMLGTDVPSVQGGLTGAESYFTSRYQTPQTNATVASLRAAAQAAALNQALQNEQEIWKQKYQNAYRNYQRRQYGKAYGGGSGGGNNGGDQNKSTWDGDTEDEVVDERITTIEGYVPGVSGGFVVPNVNPDTGEVYGYTGVPYGEEYKTNYSFRY